MQYKVFPLPEQELANLRPKFYTERNGYRTLLVAYATQSIFIHQYQELSFKRLNTAGFMTLLLPQIVIKLIRKL